MLVLTRKEKQSIKIGDNVELTVIKTGCGAVKIGIAAPDDVKIVRGELIEEQDNEYAEAG